MINQNNNQTSNINGSHLKKEVGSSKKAPTLQTQLNLQDFSLIVFKTNNPRINTPIICEDGGSY